MDQGGTQIFRFLKSDPSDSLVMMGLGMNTNHMEQRNRFGPCP